MHEARIKRFAQALFFLFTYSYIIRYSYSTKKYCGSHESCVKKIKIACNLFKSADKEIIKLYILGKWVYIYFRSREGLIQHLLDDPDPDPDQIWWWDDGIYSVQRFFLETNELEEDKSTKAKHS